ncbi:MAG: UDP-N-acetylmuramoyl-L-alanyl-D-glutamate--2,6-diaminopimelate ligase [Endomicrobia bacterium]|nr:UDP-N-acetylmuramoyl-L-alanyl-D-glutamate--2,6-diaminopimelate ligase [Endomicrobiia bacterium]
MQKLIKNILENVNVKKIYNEKLLTKFVSGIAYNSKNVQQGDIFVCLKGTHTDGVLYIEEAIKNGAVAVLTQQEVNDKYKNFSIVVEDTSIALGQVAINFYDNPSKKVLLIGVTGTNGKTTVTYLLESIFQTAGYKTGLIGTINYRFNNQIIPAANTTPFASDLQKILHEMVSSGVEVIIMEVSSHALAQKRVYGCDFDVAIFTNLSQEHLDYHITMEEYFYAKSLLFRNMNTNKKNIFSRSPLGRKVCVINYDDEYGKKLIELCSIKDILLYCKSTKNKNNNSKFIATNIEYSSGLTTFDILYPQQNKVRITTSLIGEFNVYNILASFTAAYSQNLSIDSIVQGISKTVCVPGRLEKLNIPANFQVVIDYAHTPDALQKVITTLKKLPHNKLIVVFGCGGDRDRSKRPVMGSIVTTLADYAIVTSDNPRTEDPQKILLDIEIGIKKTGNNNYEIIPDRKNAIYKALSIAQENDIVLLAGKGHETYQIIGNQKIHFDEREIVLDFFNKK